MKSVFKLVSVLIIFSIIFFILRTYGNYFGYNVDILVSNLGGLTYLYSTVGTIFAVFTGFVIVSEASDWNTLVNSSKNEVTELNEVLLWSSKLPTPIAKKISQNVESYLDAVINDEWKVLEKGEKSKKTEDALSAFHPTISDAFKENSDLGSAIFTSFNNILNYRFARVEYSWQPLPKILKFTIFFVDAVLILLSLLIGVRDTALDYIFMICIVALGSVILMVIEDLDNPLKEGEWYLKPDGYKNLLNSIRLQAKK